MKKFVLLIGVFLCIVLATSQVASAESFNENTLKNAEYKIPMEGSIASKEKLKNGKYDSNDKNDPLSVWIDKIAFGSLRKNNIVDAAVIYGYNSGGSGIFSVLGAVLNDHGKPNNVDSIILGDRVEVKKITINNGVIILTMLMHGPNEPLSTATRKVERKFKINGNRLIEISSPKYDMSGYLTTSAPKSAVPAASKSVQQPSIAAKADISPCQGVTQTKGENIKNKAELERAITKQLKDSLLKDTLPKLKLVTLLFAFTRDNWTIFFVQTHVSDELYLFYSGNPLTNRYVTHWGGWAEKNEEQEIKDWVLKHAPSIPPKLASCFARLVTH